MYNIHLLLDINKEFTKKIKKTDLHNLSIRMDFIFFKKVF